MKNRNHAIDTLKGILMFLVVLGHCSQPRFGLDVLSMKHVIYCFHMPAFFVLSALFIKPEVKKEFLSLKYLFGTYIVWFLWDLKKHLRDAPSAFVLSNWHTLNNVIWFIPAIMLFKVFFSLGLKSKPMKYLFAALTLVFIYFGQTLQSWNWYVPWGLTAAIYMIPYAMICRKFYRLEKLQRLAERAPAVLAGLGSLSFALALAAFYYRMPVSTNPETPLRLDLSHFNIPSFEGSAYLLIMLLGLTALCRLSVNKNALSWIGERTMPIFVLHVVILARIDRFTEVHPYLILPIVAMIMVFCAGLSDRLLRIDPRFRYLGA